MIDLCRSPLCEYRSKDKSNLNRHEKKCREYCSTYGGPLAKRAANFKEACKASERIDGTLKHTFSELQKFANNVTNHNITDIKTEHCRDVNNEIRNENCNNNTNTNTNHTNIIINSSIRDIYDPNLDYLKEYIQDTLVNLLPSNSKHHIESSYHRLSTFSRDVVKMVEELNRKTYFDQNHTENHSIESEDPSSSKYMEGGKWVSIQKEELFDICFELARHHFNQITCMMPDTQITSNKAKVGSDINEHWDPSHFTHSMFKKEAISKIKQIFKENDEQRQSVDKSGLNKAMEEKKKNSQRMEDRFKRNINK